MFFFNLKRVLLEEYGVVYRFREEVELGFGKLGVRRFWGFIEREFIGFGVRSEL